MDTAWPKLANAWASTVLGPALSTQLATFDSMFDQPPSGQYHGWHIYMNKDLRSILGQRVRGPFAVRYCGGGSLKRCSAQLWTRARLGRQHARRGPGLEPERLARRARCPSGSSSPPSGCSLTMRYTNRPSGIQQVLSFGGHSPSDTGR